MFRYVFNILSTQHTAPIRLFRLLFSDEGPKFETLNYTIHIGSTPTILYFDLYLYSVYAAHYVYLDFRQFALRRTRICFQEFGQH